MKLTEIMIVNEIIQRLRATGAKMYTYMDDWDYMQLHVSYDIYPDIFETDRRGEYKH